MLSLLCEYIMTQTFTQIWDDKTFMKNPTNYDKIISIPITFNAKSEIN